MIRLLVVSLALAVAMPAAADSLSPKQMERCKAMQVTLAPKKAELEAATANRDALATKTEALGEQYEDAQVMRLASASNAKAADSAKAEFDAAKRAFAQAELALQANARQFNQDVSDYNQSCTPKK
ncbi:MAG: hypothetical protein KJ871_02285 [Alphaproteobacteria bacterium]|nr:hypothetical protein [Alphaproteobacteria bacterium]MBU2083416.1 hypothetical protein [Alphaproteobacteria bacterium]MBU2143619.1 hypothetical protein [Alphaproteobacteria bacterium]MBU2195980.1 hypothetical protein [Alphaproteobacteria bacterium]